MSKLLTCWIVLKIMIYVYIWSSYIGFCSTKEDQIHNGATLHIAFPILLIPFLLMPWQLKEPMHQQEWYWHVKPEYSISNFSRVKCWCYKCIKDQSRYAPSQWETLSHFNDVSHWLGAYLDWSHMYGSWTLTCHHCSCRCPSTKRH